MDLRRKFIDELLGRRFVKDELDEESPAKAHAAEILAAMDRKGVEEAKYWSGVREGRMLASPRVRCRCKGPHVLFASHYEVLELLRKHASLFVPDSPVTTQRLFMALFEHGLANVQGDPEQSKEGLRFTLKANVQDDDFRIVRKKLAKGLGKSLDRLLLENGLRQEG